MALIAPLAAAVAVAVVATGVVLLQRHAGDGAAGRPPMLHLVGAGGMERTAVGAQAPADAAGAGPGFGYRVEGTLPTGPSRGRVHAFGAGPAPRDAVTRLATTLGVAGTPVRQGDGWTVNGSGTTLRVTDGSGWRWTFGQGFGRDGATSVSCRVVVDRGGACPPVPAGPDPREPDPGKPGPGKVIPVQPPNAGGPVRDAGPGTGSDSGAGSRPGARSNPDSGSATDSGSAGSTAASGSGSNPVTEPDPGSGSGSGYPGSGSGTGQAPPDVGVAEPAPPVGPDTPVGVPAPLDRPTLPRPPADGVRKAAGPVLVALRLDGAAIRVETYPALGLVTAAPVVDGLPTSGYETRLSYDTRLRLVGGSGWLGRPAAGAEYPLVSARRALEALPVPAIGEMPCTDSQPARCRLSQPVITGARPGLLMSWTEPATAVLVPAWLYDVRGWPAPLAAIAVDPAYLAPPTASSKAPLQPGAPGQIPPAPPKSGSAAPGQPAPGSRTGGPPVPVPPPTR